MENCNVLTVHFSCTPTFNAPFLSLSSSRLDLSSVSKASSSIAKQPLTSTGLSMVDLSKNVIDLAISTIKKTHSVTIATVPEEIKANLEVRV